MPFSNKDVTEKLTLGYQKISPDADDSKSSVCDSSEKDDTVITHEEKKPLTEEVSSQPDIVIPPDGGWGWIVVVASFMCNLVVDGTIFSFGTFLEEIAKEFNVTKAEVTLVGSLMSGFYLIAGPFVSAIANRYGFRLVTIFGAIFSAAALAISNFATSVPFLCVTYGVLGVEEPAPILQKLEQSTDPKGLKRKHYVDPDIQPGPSEWIICERNPELYAGIGFGFMYAPSIIILGFYFERWRALATGIAVCGSGIGTFVYAPVTEVLISKLGWRGAMLSQAAIILSCVICGALYRPLKPIKIEAPDQDEPKEEYKVPLAAQIKMEAAIKFMKRDSIGSIDHQSSIPRLLGVNNNAVYPRVSDVYHTICVSNGAVTSRPSVENKMAWFRERSKTEGKLPLSHINKFKRTRFEMSHEVIRPLYRDDIFFTASLARLPQYTSQTSVKYNLSVTRVPTKNDIEEETMKKCTLCPEAFRRALATMLDISLFRSPTFIVLAAGGFFTMMGFFVPYMFMVDRARHAHYDKMTAVWLVSATGIANTVGRVMYGVISSLPRTNALVIINIALTVGGIATIFSGFSMSVEYQFAYTVLFGLSISSFASIRSIAVVDLLGLEKLTNAFGLLLLFQGVAAIIGAPLAGAFMNATGSYDACFYLSGGMILFSAVICYPLNRINAWEKDRELKKKSTDVLV